MPKTIHVIIIVIKCSWCLYCSRYARSGKGGAKQLSASEVWYNNLLLVYMLFIQECPDLCMLCMLKLHAIWKTGQKTFIYFTCPLDKCNRDLTSPDVKCTCPNKSRVKSCIYTCTYYIGYVALKIVHLWHVESSRNKVVCMRWHVTPARTIFITKNCRCKLTSARLAFFP